MQTVAQTTSEVSEQVAESRAELEAMMPSTPARVLKFNLMMPDGRSRQEWSFTQEELGYMPVQEFVTLMSETIEQFAQGDVGKTIADLLAGGERVTMPEDFSAENVQKAVDENMVLVEAFFKVVRIIPGLQLEIFCMSLGIPPEQRAWFKNAISRPPSQGGLTVDEGFDILIFFVRQNAKLIRRFFAEKAAEFINAVRQEVFDQEVVEGTATETTNETPSDTPGSTPSNISSPDTLVSVS